MRAEGSSIAARKGDGIGARTGGGVPTERGGNGIVVPGMRMHYFKVHLLRGPFWEEDRQTHDDHLAEAFKDLKPIACRLVWNAITNERMSAGEGKAITWCGGSSTKGKAEVVCLKATQPTIFH